jgi:LysM repeat protein
MAIDARTRALLDKYYSQAIAGVTSDEDELLVAEDMLRRAQSGAVPDDAGAKTIVIDPRRKVPLDNPLLVKSAASALRQENLKRFLPLGGLIAVAIVVVSLINRGGGKEEAAMAAASGTPGGTVITGTVTLTATPTPTLTPTSVPTPFDTATPTATVAPTPTDTPSPLPNATPTPMVIAYERTPVSVEPSQSMIIWPVTIEIKERIFPVAITGLTDEGRLWGYAPEDNRISWLAGSWVNVILGLPFSFSNLELLESLEINDPLMIRDNHAVIHRFKISDVRVVEQHQIETLRQKEAGLTLVLLNQNVGEHEGDRLIAKAIPERLVGETGEFSTRPTATATPLPTSTALPTSTVSASTWITYTVRGGDTLMGIAAAFSSTVEILVEANGIVSPSLIHPGNVLSIPVTAGGEERR